MVILEPIDRAPARVNPKGSVPAVVTPGSLSPAVAIADATVLPTVPPTAGVVAVLEIEVMTPLFADTACTV